MLLPHYACPGEGLGLGGGARAESWSETQVLEVSNPSLWAGAHRRRGATPLLPWLGSLPLRSCVLQSVVVPRCRGTAEALQITVAHILGDAGSPYLTGLVRSVQVCGGGRGTWEVLFLTMSWVHLVGLANTPLFMADLQCPAG